MSDNKEHWSKRAWQGLVLLLVIALGARVVYGLLGPLLPLVGVGVTLGVLYMVVLGRRGE